MGSIIDEINTQLDEIERREHVRILHAVESGSRAWGFASKDSDYDVRFVYMRRVEDYLRLNAYRDVIEWQLDEVLDINGWDLKKALIHFAKGNVTLFEWSGSPVVYRTTKEWKQISDAAKQYFSIKAGAYRYYGTAKSTYENHLKGERVRYKKYFYALRPLLAALYIERFHEMAPVAFADLVKMEMSERLRSAINELLEIKKVTTEKEENPQMPAIQEFIVSELERQEKIVKSLPDDRNKDISTLDETFLNLVLTK